MNALTRRLEGLAPRFALWRAQLGYELAALGWPGWIALVLLAGACAAALGLPTLDALAARRAAALASVRQALDQARAAPLRKSADGDVQALLVRFEPADKLADFVEAVHQRAADHQVEIDHAEYRAQSDLRGRALRYEIILPARGSYPGLRNWLAAVLQDHPGATLLEFSMRRASDGAGRLDARVRLASYLRSGA